MPSRESWEGVREHADGLCGEHFDSVEGIWQRLQVGCARRLLQEAEAARQSAETELRQIKAAAKVGADRAEARAKALSEAARAAEAAAKGSAAEAAQAAARAAELDAQLAGARQALAASEALFAAERERLAPYFGAGLERLPAADLDTLEQFHYKGLNRLRPLLVRASASALPCPAYIFCHPVQ